MTFNKGFLRLSAAALALLLVSGAWAASGYAKPGPGYLGIMFHDVNDSEIAPLHLKDGHGAEITVVDHDGPAGKADLRVHDVVLSMNGVTVDGEDQLHRMLHDLQSGRTVSLLICRDGAEHTVNATLGKQTEIEKKASANRWKGPSPPPGQDDALFAAPISGDATATPKQTFGHNFMPGHILSTLTPTYTGATVDAVGSQLADVLGVKDGKGLFVHGVDGNSPAAVAGLHAGDVVTKVNGGRVATEKDWTRSLRDSKGREVGLTVIRDRKEQTLTMVPDSKKRSSVDVPMPSNELPTAEPRPVIM